MIWNDLKIFADSLSDAELLLDVSVVDFIDDQIYEVDEADRTEELYDLDGSIVTKSEVEASFDDDQVEELQDALSGVYVLIPNGAPVLIRY